MKAGIHPKYNKGTTVKCACGNTFISGSTLDVIEVEICSSCHPFWTGQENTLDAAGRVDRFKKRASKSVATTTKVKKAA